jgi:hypothetical protein
MPEAEPNTTDVINFIESEDEDLIIETDPEPQYLQQPG